MNSFISPLLESESFRELSSVLDNKKIPCALATGVIDSQKSHLMFSLFETKNRPALIITDSELKAKDIYNDLRFFAGDVVSVYPSRDFIFYAADCRSLDIDAQRVRAIRSIFEENHVVVLSAEALMDRFVSKESFVSSVFTIEGGGSYVLDTIIERLVGMGYERCATTVAIGQFSVRGGILDLFPINSDYAIRAEFWGDEVDSLRILDTLTQRSVDRIDDICIYPVSQLVQSDFTQDINICDYLKPNTLIFVDEPSRVTAHLENVYYEFQESIKERIMSGHFPASQAKMLLEPSAVLHKLKNFPVTLLSSLTHTVKLFTVTSIVHFDVRSVSSFKLAGDIKGTDGFIEELRYWCKSDYRVVILTNSQKQAEDVEKALIEADISSKYVDNFVDSVDISRGQVTLTRGGLRHGFDYAHIKFAVVSTGDFERSKKRVKARKRGEVINSFMDLTVGDFIVHESHGIGIYRGIEQIVSDGIRKDYLRLEYADGGVLFVNVNQMDMIQKYIGQDGRAKLNRLGGSSWANTKSRAKKAAADIAKDLIELYSKRNLSTGIVFEPYSVWEKEFDETFPYEETDDQLLAIADVRADMEQGKIMDRLVCGDVGYGKTEIAIRAAFKTVLGGYQVAYLVPTTILAQQVYNSFVQRMQGFGINIACLSRFRSKKEQEATITKLKRGGVDIIVGTHRILSKDVVFKNLGLLVVDEEQRFGVTHKEKIKTLKENVNVLTLSATPIPRTLHLSLTGIRDMSILEEPPQERRPIQTYVTEYNPEFIKDAIYRELSREGQVYYLHNRVQNIADVAARISALVPEANVAYAHGQMSEKELESIMMDFIDGTIDVLVCTTIVENGIDISNVNTIIINDADKMGLAQLYQLRGRVGRSNRLAYAYLMYKKDKVLNEIAEKRLQTIREFTQFGSGFKIAMKDLEFRGSGNLLGAQQHGNIDAVGYELYCKLLNECIMEQSGKLVRPDFETSVEIKVNAFIPSNYIDDEIQKLEVYKKISLIDDERDFYDVQEEMEDRFGDIPASVQNLLDVALLKAYAHKMGIVSLTQKEDSFMFYFKNDQDFTPEIDPRGENLFKLIKDNKGKIFYSNIPAPYLTYRVDTKDFTPRMIMEFLKSLVTIAT